MKCERLTWDLLIRTVDKELSPAEMAWVPAHIAECSECRHECDAIQGISQDVGAYVNRLPVVDGLADRAELAKLKSNRQAPDRVMRRFGWGMAIAATLAIGILVAPKQRITNVEKPAVEQVAAATSNAIEVDGETFVALPYSNPDLPSVAPRIVQMQVPVSSLADIGLGLEQMASEVANQDRTVLADVLLGADGQPLGVHVLSWE
jgi:anti-sigma factor RsiW